MNLLIERLIAALFLAALGSAFAVGFKRVSHLGLCLLISFAAGALLAVALLHILPETLKQIGFLSGVLSFLSGYLLFFLVNRYVFHICPACAATHTEVNFKSVTPAMVVALSVHSFMDGLALYSSGVVPGASGLLILAAVAYHKLPEGMALALVARGSGMGRARAFVLSFSVEAFTTVAGAVAGLWVLSSQIERWIGYLLGHIGGGFLFLVFHALLSELFKHHPRSTVIAASLGAVSIAATGFLIHAF